MCVCVYVYSCDLVCLLVFKCVHAGICAAAANVYLRPNIFPDFIRSVIILGCHYTTLVRFVFKMHMDHLARVTPTPDFLA